MVALVRQDAVSKPVCPNAGAEFEADATEIARLYCDLDKVSERSKYRRSRCPPSANSPHRRGAARFSTTPISVTSMARSAQYCRATSPARRPVRQAEDIAGDPRAGAYRAARTEFGQFSDAGAVAAGLEKYLGRVPAVLFALALLDACLIGAAAVSLSTAYAIGDVLDLRHSLHRKPTEAKAFYGVY
jgi:Natural resistance-associated macrophage protein